MTNKWTLEIMFEYLQHGIRIALRLLPVAIAVYCRPVDVWHVYVPIPYLLFDVLTRLRRARRFGARDEPARINQQHIQNPRPSPGKQNGKNQTHALVKA